jgi:hypothetical protein
MAIVLFRRLQNKTREKIEVVSQIEVIQERLTTQITLTRNRQVYSTVEITE